MKGDGSKKEGYGKRSERFVKRLARRLLAALSSRHDPSSSLHIDPAAIKKVIVIRQHNQFGDVLCTVPLLRVLRRKFNLDELAVVVSPQNISALAGCTYVTDLLNYDKLAFYKHPSSFFRFVRKLRRKYDLLIVPSNVSISLTNDIMAFIANANHKLGPGSLDSKANRTSSVYDVAVNLDWENSLEHQYYRNMKVAEPLGITRVDDDGGLEYSVDPATAAEVRSMVERMSRTGVRRVALHAGAGKPPNRWDVAAFAALSELLHDRLGADLFITEGPMDHEVIERLAALLTVPFVRVRNSAISFVAAFLRQMDVVVTNDTGIMHLAAAVGTSTLSLFGPTDPLQWAPLGKNHRFILGRGGDINTIEVSKVFDSVMKLMKISKDRNGFFLQGEGKTP